MRLSRKIRVIKKIDDFCKETFKERYTIEFVANTYVYLNIICKDDDCNEYFTVSKILTNDDLIELKRNCDKLEEFKCELIHEMKIFQNIRPEAP